MRRIIILLAALLAAAACRQAQDTRYFAPEVEFGSAQYAVSAGDGGLDIDIRLSRPATQAFLVFLTVDSSLEEGVQFRTSRNVEIAAGQQAASLRVDLVDDEIWDESSWIELLLRPGERYTVDPGKNCSARISISKVIPVPILRLVRPEEEIVTNPFFAETLHFELESDREAASGLDVDLEFGDLAYGTDYLIPGSDASSVLLPAGSTRRAFDVQILKKDVSGYDKLAALTVRPRKGSYTVASGEGSVTVRLNDPSVDFSPLFRTAALQNGRGFQIRQAIRAADGSWNGNTTVDIGVSSDGSNYLRNFRNLYDHPSFNCLANASISQLFRLGDLTPRYLYPNGIAILDYGNDQNHREFSPADSVMRFVLDKGETKKGSICLHSPRTFVAVIGSYADWQDKSSGENAWIKDSRANQGDILASTHPAIQGRISVTLERLEGRFDFTDTEAPVLLTAWFQSDSDLFMQADEANGKDPASTYAVTREDGLWKVDYKLWPR